MPAFNGLFCKSEFRLAWFSFFLFFQTFGITFCLRGRHFINDGDAPLRLKPLAVHLRCRRCRRGQWILLLLHLLPGQYFPISGTVLYFVSLLQWKKLWKVLNWLSYKLWWTSHYGFHVSAPNYKLVNKIQRSRIGEWHSWFLYVCAPPPPPVAELELSEMSSVDCLLIDQRRRGSIAPLVLLPPLLPWLPLTEFPFSLTTAEGVVQTSLVGGIFDKFEHVSNIYVQKVKVKKHEVKVTQNLDTVWVQFRGVCSTHGQIVFNM
jgi:hypothetical protein